MPTLTQVPFLAIVFGDEPPNSVDSDELRRLYARELGPDGEFEIVHHRRYQRYRLAPTPNDEAVRRQVARGTKQVVVLLPISCDYQEGAVGLRRFTQPDAEFKAFFRPWSPFASINFTFARWLQDTRGPMVDGCFCFNRQMSAERRRVC